MLKKGFGKIRYFLVLALFLVIPIKAWGGFLVTGASFPIVDTDELGENEADQLFFFWDLRDRASFFQVTNTCDFIVEVHVQVFNAANGCEETDFFDEFSENDTNVYNLSNLASNCDIVPSPFVGNIDCSSGDGLAPQGDIFGGAAFGFVAVSTTDDDDCLIGNFRVIDDAGYEYRVNAAGLDSSDASVQRNGAGEILGTFFSEIFSFTDDYTFNFNNADFSDVVGIAARIGDFPPGGGARVLAGFSVTFDVTLFNAAEAPRSCSPVTFGCATDTGINQAIPNSKNGSRICTGPDETGYMDLLVLAPAFAPGVGFGGADFFVGFIGLNNGDGLGSMDTWWASPLLTTDFGPQ